MALIYVTETPGNNALTAARMMAAARRADAAQAREAGVKADCAAMLSDWQAAGATVVAVEVEHFDGGRMWQHLSPADAAEYLLFVGTHPESYTLSDLEVVS